ncbi:MAG TPA: hypothetical protein VK530_19750, partial [Candidatus Acidoferrum sp.]|nr:hypothetical protein [Candidatus Acidoferrum sp.]
MRSPTRAILWEICARNRYALMFAFGVMPLCAVLVAATRWYLVWSGRPLPDEIGDPGPLVLAVTATALLGLLSLASIFWSFSFTSVDERGRFGGFPVRLFTLPLFTRSAVAPPVFAGVMAVVAAYSVWVFLLFILLGKGEPIPWQTVAWQVLVVATGFVSIQTLVWLLYPFRFGRMVIIAAVALVCFWLFVWVPDMNFHQRPVAWFVAGTAGFAVSVASAFGAVSWERRGGWQNLGRFGFQVWSRASRAFRSPAAAQLWFEWRRKGIFGAACIGIGMSAALMVWTVPESLMMQDPSEGLPRVPPRIELAIFWSLPLTAYIITLAFGGAFGKSDPWGPEIAITSFHAGRPMSTAHLAFAKMRAAARMISLAWCIFIVATLVFTFIHPHMREWLAEKFWPRFLDAHPLLLQWITNPVVLLTILLVQWHIVIQSMSVILSGERRRVMIGGWIGMIAFWLFVGIIAWFCNYPRHLEFWRPVLPFVAILLMIWKSFWTVSVFRQARRELLTTKQSIALMAIWIVMVAGIAFSVTLANHV